MQFTNKQLIAILLVLTVLISILGATTAYSGVIAYTAIKSAGASSSGGTSSGSNAGTPSGTAATTSKASGTTAAAAGTTSAIQAQNAAPTYPSGSSGNTAAPAATEAPAAAENPGSIANVVALYKKANAQAKANVATSTMTYTGGTNYNGVAEAGGLSWIAEKLMGSLLKEQEINEVHTDDAKDVVPPAGYDCNLTEADVASVTYEDKGDTIFVTITMKPDLNPEKGYGTGSVCNIITEKQITEPVEPYGVKLSNIKCEYDGAYVEATIDKATGNLMEVYTKMPMYLSLTAKLGFTINGRIGLQFVEKWVFGY